MNKLNELIERFVRASIWPWNWADGVMENSGIGLNTGDVEWGQSFPAMYEYKIVLCHDSHHDFSRTINHHGAIGWRFVSSHYVAWDRMIHFVFERELIVSNTIEDGDNGKS